ncbi:tetratricopeptide repeat protein, partial [Streptomyces beijiangensis]
ALASAQQASGAVDGALTLFEAAMNEYGRVLGPDHPWTLIARVNHASACIAGGDTPRAISLYVSVIADHQRILGPDH